MNDTKKTILEKAFMIFLEKGYHGTSISDIQKELEIGRATLYHHFKNKKELFLAVMDGVFTATSGEINPEKTADFTIAELIKYLKQKLYDEMAQLIQLNDKNIGMIDFFMLSSEALRINPEYQKRSKEIHEKAFGIWEKAIINSIKKGEVKKNIDVKATAKLFVHVKHGIEVLSTSSEMEQSAIETQQGYDTIYKLIRK